jgi:hypothetical protein
MSSIRHLTRVKDKRKGKRNEKLVVPLSPRSYLGLCRRFYRVDYDALADSARPDGLGRWDKARPIVVLHQSNRCSGLVIETLESARPLLVGRAAFLRSRPGSWTFFGRAVNKPATIGMNEAYLICCGGGDRNSQ